MFIPDSRVCRCTSVYITRMYLTKFEQFQTSLDKFRQVQTIFNKIFRKILTSLNLWMSVYKKFVKTRQCTVYSIHVCRCTSVYVTLTASVSASATSFVYPMFGSKNSSKRRPGFMFSWFVCKYYVVLVHCTSCRGTQGASFPMTESAVVDMYGWSLLNLAQLALSGSIWLKSAKNKFYWSTWYDFTIFKKLISPNLFGFRFRWLHMTKIRQK